MADAAGPAVTPGDVLMNSYNDAVSREQGAITQRTAPQSRNQAFGEGAAPKPASSVQQNIAPGYKPGSVQDQMHPAPNGVDAAGADRMLAGGGTLPAPNGVSASTYEEQRPLLSTQMNF